MLHYMTHMRKIVFASRELHCRIWALGVALIVAITCASRPAIAGDTFSRSGSVGAQFLKIGVGSRYLGMGEAAVATKGDVFSLYWNPAALSELEGQEIGFARVDWLLDVNLNYVAYARRIEGFGVFALGMTALTAPEMEVTTIDQQEGTGQYYDASSYAIEVGYARELTDKFAFGGGIKFIQERIFRETASTFAFDFGTMLYTGFRTLRLGMNISNLGGQERFDGPNLGVPYRGDNTDNSKPPQDARIAVEDYDLPLIFRVGMSYDVEFESTSRLTLASEMKHPNDNEQQASLGAEYSYNDHFFLRSGYKFNYSEEGLTLGAGLQAPIFNESSITIDYAWSDFGRLNSAHRFSLGLSF